MKIHKTWPLKLLFKILISFLTYEDNKLKTAFKIYNNCFKFQIIYFLILFLSYINKILAKKLDILLIIFGSILKTLASLIKTLFLLK